MKTKVFVNFIDPLRRAFDDPFPDMSKSSELFIRLDSALDHFSVDTLQQAVIRLQNVWQSRNFPTQAACVAACVDVHEKKAGQKTQFPVIHEKTPEWEAWQAHYRATGDWRYGQLMMNNRWTVPSLWPPGYDGQHSETGERHV